MKLQIFTSILRDFYPGIKLAYICDEPIYFKWDDDKLFYPFKYYADICVPSKAGDLVQTDKTIDEIALDMVIMSPEMVMTLKESESGKISISIFVITEDWADDDYSGFNVWFTSDMASAKQKMNLAIKEAMKGGGIFDLLGEEGIEEDSSELSYEIYSEGYYCSSHYSIYIKEDVFTCSAEFIKNLADGGGAHE